MRTLKSLKAELKGITQEFVDAVNEWRRLRDRGAPWDMQEAAEAYVGSCFQIMQDCGYEIQQRKLAATRLQRYLLNEYGPNNGGKHDG